MSLQIAAEHLASKGRGPDTTLVHMSHGEVKSLQDIAKAHGGSLTVNPSTGLPEAGFLSSILPMVAGAALMGVSGGAINPMTAGLLVGGGSMLLNPRQSLGQGLMAGLSAYSGAGLGQALAQQGMMAAAGVPEAAKQVGALTAESTSAQVAAAQQAAAEAAAKTSAAQTAFRGGDLMANAGTMGQGIASLGQEGGMSGLVSNLGGPGKAIMTGAQVAAPLVMQSEDRPVAVPQVDRDPGQQYTYYPGAALPTPEPNIQGRENAYYSGGYRPKTTTPMPNNFGVNNIGRLMADGGAVGWPAGESVMKMADGGVSGYGFGGIIDLINNNPEFAKKFHGAFDEADPGKKYMYDAQNQQYTQQMASGGVSDDQYNLGGYSDGGRLLRGPGDGVSDSIPAVIGKKQPARLADGEFVVPARIVSELGNGSTEAGARKLYAMMDRVQGARASTVGKGKVAKNSKADKHLPA
jgi:hypothetical protein